MLLTVCFEMAVVEVTLFVITDYISVISIAYEKEELKSTKKTQ